MKKIIKEALIFMGGATVGFASGAVVVVGRAIENEHIRNGIRNSIYDKVGEVLYGYKPTSYPDSSYRWRNTSNVSYKSYYYRRSYDKHVDKPFFDNREEAERVLSQMRKVIDLYGYCTVAYMYDLCDIVSNYTDNKYGWTTLKDAKIIRVRIRDGYTFELPKAVAVD